MNPRSSLLERGFCFYYENKYDDLQLVKLIEKRLVTKIKLPLIKTQSSVKIWEGKSPYNNSNIMAILTGLNKPSKNPKTGSMIQLWILQKDEPPHKAIKYEGGDEGICGDCILSPYRSKRARQNGHDIPSCYVGRRAFQAPYSVWRYNKNKPVELNKAIKSIKNSTLPIRYGAYGDPAMLPESLLSKLYKAAAIGHTAYTHQAHQSWAQWLKPYAMASVSSKYDAKIYQALGWRTFRIGKDPEPNEIICPNYTHNIQCIKCKLCDGKRGSDDKRKNIVIPAH